MLLTSIIALVIALCIVQSVCILIQIGIVLSFLVWPIREITVKEFIWIVALNLIPCTAALSLIYLIKLRLEL